jgi:hypothetical protein
VPLAAAFLFAAEAMATNDYVRRESKTPRLAFVIGSVELPAAKNAAPNAVGFSEFRVANL